MKQTFFHGTSFDNLASILRNGFDLYSDKIWSPSENGIYFWSPDALTEAGECEEEWQNDSAKQHAYESAQMAMTLAKDGRCVVLEVELDSEDVSPDTSCEHMTGAVVTFKPVKPSKIKAVYVSPDLSMIKGYYIALARRLELFAGQFSPIQNKIADAFDKAEFYIESDEFPLEKVENPLALAG